MTALKLDEHSTTLTDEPKDVADRRGVPKRLLDVTAILIALCAVFIYASVSDNVFDRLPHVEDEMSLLYQGRTIANGYIRGPLHEADEFFGIRFVLETESYRYGIYPPGFPLLLALGVLIGQPWIVNPVLGGIVVGLVYLCGVRLYGSRGIGLLAAALIAFSPFVMLQAASFMAHVAALMWIMAFLLLFDAARRGGRWWVGALAGVAIGMVFLIRPFTGVAVAIPFIIWAMVDLYRMPARAVTIYSPMGLVGIFAGWVYLIYNWYTTGDPLLTGFQALWEYNRPGFGEDVGRFGHTVESGLNITRDNIEVLSEFLYGWPFHLSYVPVLLGIAVMLVGFGHRIRRWWRERRELAATDDAQITDGDREPAENWDLALVSLAAMIVIFHIAYWTTGRMYGPRFYFEGLGALALLSSRGILGLVALVTGGIRRLAPARLSTRSLRWGVMTVVVAMLAVLFIQGHQTFTQEQFDRYRNWYGVNRDDLEKVESAGLSNAIVFVPHEEWTDAAPFLAQNDPQLQNDVIYAKHFDDEYNQRLRKYYPEREFWVYQDGELRQLDP